MDVHFKPFGKASYKKNDDVISGYTFECQHGPTECLGNMIHACTLKYVSPNLIPDMIGCMIDNNREPKSIGETCAKSLEVQKKHKFSFENVLFNELNFNLL